MTMAAATMDTGMVTAGISVARTVPRNRKITMSTRISVSDSANTTFLSDAAMNTPLSMLTSTLMSLGSVGWISSSRSFTAAEVASTLAFDCGMMAMDRPITPLERDRLRSSSEARRTSATSPSRTR